MARTNDPSAATKKAWLTRHRAQEGDHKEVVQQRGDFRAAVLERASANSITDLISSTKGDFAKAEAANVFSVGVRTSGLDLPARALKTLAGIEMVTDDQIRKLFKAGKNEVIGSVYGKRTVKLNADYISEAFIKPDEAARLVAHEWLAIARARKARISKYAQQDWQEHFSEAFAAYATKKGRPRLKKLEPKAFEFMERLWRDPTMWSH